MSITKRNPAADLIRILAFFLVVSVHFFLNNDFYLCTVEGKRMYIMTLMRSFSMICVSLFLTLSGYLLRKKQLEKSYYGRLGKIITTYVLASLLCIVYSVVFQKQDLSIKNVIGGILGFTAAPYSWYIEMYIGLFLLIPFLNIIYNSLPSQKAKIWLIITTVLLTAMPSVLNIYNFSSLGWWALPSSSSNTSKLIPAWWEGFYPITYYFIGCYLSEYGLKMKKTLNATLILFWTVLSGTFCYWRSYKVAFIWGAWCNYGSFFNVVLTVLVFAFFININYDKFPQKLSRFIQKISGLCLGGYLLSWIFDSTFYPILLKHTPSVTSRLEYYFIIVPAVFVSSLLLSYLVSKVQLLAEFAYKKSASLLKNKLKRSSRKGVSL